MRYAAALSTHPVSAYATGEVIGEIFEALGPHPDLLIVVGRPGHAGAMEDIASTAHRLLEPAVMIGGVVDGVGGATRLVADGPALALWAATGGPAEPFGPGLPARSGSFVLSLDTTEPEAGATDVAARIQGPLVSGDRIVGAGPVGVAIHDSWAPALFTLPRLVPVGPPLVITEASGRRIVRFDDQPALPLLVDVLREQRAARRFGDIRSVALRVLRREEESDGVVAMIAGRDRQTGDVVLVDDLNVRAGDLAVLHVPAHDGYDRLADGFAGGADAAGALVFTALPAEGPMGFGELDPDRTPLPAASLIVASRRLLCAPGEGTADREPAAAIALFP